MYDLIREPLMTIWFGNFYRPAYDDRDFVQEGMERIRAMGFNAVMLDSKAWEDFFQRYGGGEASPYVAQQEFMMAAAARAGLGHLFLSLYCNGDNLYPHIRFSPPVFGESVTNADGTDGRWYKYWSSLAQDTQTEHVAGLLSLYRENHAAFFLQGETRLPMCSMWDPVVQPSFDEEGQKRYMGWLQKRYGDIAALNAAYGASFPSFEALRLQDVWRGDPAALTAREIHENAPVFRMWADSQAWRAEELALYFQEMKRRLHEVEPKLYLMPDLSQWGHFLNVWTVRREDVRFCDVWDTATRGLDMRLIAPQVDMCHYYTVPVTFDGDPDAYAVSCQHAHIRSLNAGRPFLGGIYYGRYLYNDLYRYITPEEIVGSIALSGAAGVSAYGFCGMDDGGLLHRMDEGFVSSLTRANEWAKRVIPMLGKRMKSRAALLFPTAMALLEPLSVEGAAARRADLLGLFHALCDAGFSPDMVEARDVIDGIEDRDVLLIPADDCYPVRRDLRLEEALRAFVHNGGTVIHGLWGKAAEFAFSLRPCTTDGACYTYQGEGGLVLGDSFVSYPGEPLALWREDGKSCISRTAVGRGAVYSFGFMPGYQFAARHSPHVPYSQRNNALYPLPHMEHNALKDILARAARRDVPFAMKDVECAEFENGLLAVNHRSTPARLPVSGPCLCPQPMADGLLPAHCPAFFPKENGRP